MLARTIPKMIEIELHLTSKPTAISADPGQIEQVIMNLAVNARDAMPEGGKLIISTQKATLDRRFCHNNPGATPGEHIRLHIADTGTGMNRKTLERIFEPFFTTKKPRKGTGLGLSIVYGIVKNHGGYITCDSKPMRGTEFTIYLPTIPRGVKKKEPSELETDKERLKGFETILVVEDNAGVRSVCQRILKKFGYNVHTAANGEDALDLYRRQTNEIDLVLLDINMPGMGGKRCLEELLKINSKAKVIITTGYPIKKQLKEKIAASTKAFIDKPYESDTLLKTTRRILDA